MTPQPEPSYFDDKIRKPGRKVIDEIKAGRKRTLPALWRRCLDDLWKRYDGICAYMCTYIAPVTGARTVEHYAPKSAAIELTYEWLNYRLVCSTLNGWKKNFEDVLDPFEIENAWFILLFPFCKVAPAPGLAAPRRRRVEQTITRLRLNHAKCVAERWEYLDPYQSGTVSVAFIQRRSPFLAMELKRQGLLKPGD